MLQKQGAGPSACSDKGTKGGRERTSGRSHPNRPPEVPHGRPRLSPCTDRLYFSLGPLPQTVILQWSKTCPSLPPKFYPFSKSSQTPPPPISRCLSAISDALLCPHKSPHVYLTPKSAPSACKSGTRSRLHGELVRTRFRCH